MDGVPVRLWLQDGVRRVQRWHHMPADPHHQQWVTVGVCEAGWFVEHVRQVDVPTLVFGGEAAARAYAAGLMAGCGPWVEVPAGYDARGEPDTPGPWVYVGGRWRRP